MELMLTIIVVMCHITILAVSAALSYHWWQDYREMDKWVTELEKEVDR